MELVVEHTDPGLQGDRSTGGTKPATLETGAADPGAAVHHHRREAQGRHPRRPVPRPRQLSLTSMAARSQGAQARRRRPLRGRPARRRPAGVAARPDRRRPTRRCPSTRSRLVEGVAEHAARIDELLDAHAADWSLDRLPDVDRAILRHGALRAAAGPTTCRTPWRSTRRWSWRRRCPPTTRRRSSTASSAGCCGRRPRSATERTPARHRAAAGAPASSRKAGRAPVGGPALRVRRCSAAVTGGAAASQCGSSSSAASTRVVGASATSTPHSMSRAVSSSGLSRR